ncbi:MAG: hypothetical protein WC959_10940 [Kiritimatiellales bacterium]
MKYSLKIKTLKRGWQDRDNLILHSAFQCLVDFVEEEMFHEIASRTRSEDNPAEAAVYDEVLYLYNWWTQERPARKDPLNDKTIPRPTEKERWEPQLDGSSLLLSVDPIKYPEYVNALKESRRLDDEWKDEDQRNLHRLIDLRFYLWT